MKYGTRILPDSLTAPYDPFGHPALQQTVCIWPRYSIWRLFLFDVEENVPNVRYR